MMTGPLDEHLASLAALRGIAPDEVLPAHEYRFTDLDGRLDDLVAHHQERLDEVIGALRAVPAGQSAWQVATRVPWSRPWDQLSAFPRQAALGEVVAHLRHLEGQGRAGYADADGVALWRAIS
jgi:hypothetical protein